MYRLSAIYIFFFFFFNETATTEIYTLSLHDALPISTRTTARSCSCWRPRRRTRRGTWRSEEHTSESSHSSISYAVFCLKKKKKTLGTKHSRKKKKNRRRDETAQKTK